MEWGRQRNLRPDLPTVSPQHDLTARTRRRNWNVEVLPYAVLMQTIFCYDYAPPKRVARSVVYLVDEPKVIFGCGFIATWIGSSGAI